jgi:hypothetical protein
MSQTRVEALACARRIVFECMRRELEESAGRRTAERVVEIVLADERYQRRPKRATSPRGLLGNTQSRAGTARGRKTPHCMAMLLISSLSCAFAVTWFAALVAIRR